MHGIEQRFGGVHAPCGVDFDLRAGEVHALLGANPDGAAGGGASGMAPGAAPA